MRTICSLVVDVNKKINAEGIGVSVIEILEKVFLVVGTVLHPEGGAVEFTLPGIFRAADRSRGLGGDCGQKDREKCESQEEIHLLFLFTRAFQPKVSSLVSPNCFEISMAKVPP